VDVLIIVVRYNLSDVGSPRMCCLHSVMFKNYMKIAHTHTHTHTHRHIVEYSKEGKNYKKNYVEMQIIYVRGLSRN
jgi:hypothetical protein